MARCNEQGRKLSISVFIAGDPAPQGSKRHVGHGRMIESSKKVAPWRSDIRTAVTKEDGTPKEFFDGDVAVTMIFFLRRPKGAPKKRPYVSAAKKPDLDKLERAVLDAVTSAGVWNDDCQVVKMTSRKVVCFDNEGPGLRLLIDKCEDGGYR